MRKPLAALLFLAACGGRYYKDAVMEMAPREPVASGETYGKIVDNPVIATADQPRSTFSIDVDTASMSNVRRFLESGQLPPKDAVRTEEMINYFDYHYPDPADGAPIAASTELGPSPYHAGDEILKIGLQGRRIAEADRPPLNLVFLIDTSGSMEDADKLPLLKQAFALLVDRLRPEDRVGIVTYAGSAGVALEPTADHDQILEAIDGLDAGGSTAGEGGLRAAYELARQHYDGHAANRVILATDGDFNVGITDDDALTALVTQEAKSGIALTTLGFGTGNYDDKRMEELADHGNGNYGYVDNQAEAKKLLVEQAGGTLVTIAKDVKVQVEFDPKEVSSYRLIGYEDRVMANQDFENDDKDAGEMGAGHTVTALYEITPVAGAPAAPVASVHVRWKEPDGDRATEAAFDVGAAAPSLADESADLRFATAIAGFGMLLRQSEHAGEASWKQVRDLARDAAGEDTRRLALVSLIESAARLSGVNLGPQVAQSPSSGSR